MATPKSVAVPAGVAALAHAVAVHRDLAARAERAAEHHRQRRAALHDAVLKRRQVAGRLSATDADHATSEAGVDAAAREADRAEAVAAGIRTALAEATDAVAAARADAKDAIESSAEARLEDLERGYRAAMARAAGIAAEAVALAEAAGLDWRAGPLWRTRWPASLLRSDAILSLGSEPGQILPADSPAATSLRAWRAELAEAERIAALAAQQEAAA